MSFIRLWRLIFLLLLLGFLFSFLLCLYLLSSLNQYAIPIYIGDLLRLRWYIFFHRFPSLV